jgi:carboxymethylenebutenolidase
MIEFRANGRMAPGYLTRPKSGSGPRLIVIQEWWGLVGHITSVADRFAAEGFVVLAPDLYHGTKTTSPDEAGKLLMALNIAEAGKDIRGAALHLASMPGVRPKKVGVLGFCMGGQLAMYAAAKYPEQIAAAVDFYGIHPNAKVEPAELRVPLQAHFAEQDRSVPVASARAFMKRISDAGGDVEAYYYDAPHAFFNDARPEVFNKDAAALAWQRALVFLRANVGSWDPC